MAIRIGLIGNVDVGKTTLLGLLTKLKSDEYDDGRGYARSKVLRFPHEIESGRTSTMTKEHTVINGKIIEFVDLAGHEPYLKTTMSGLCGSCLDYAFLIIGANMGTIGMTKEHLNIALGLKIPLIVIITKIDIAPEKKLKETISDLKLLLRRAGSKTFMVSINDVPTLLSCVSNPKKTPVLQISNKTGHNINLLKEIISSLPSHYQFKNIDGVNRFWIHHVYNVPGTGLVYYGIVTSGSIKKLSKIQLGPFDGKFKEVIIRSLHNDDRHDVDELHMGQTGCIALRKFVKNPIKRKNIKKGMIFCNQPQCIREFEALILIYHHTTTIKSGYKCIIHCGLVRQTIEFMEINTGILRTGEHGIVKCRFVYRPEYLEENTRFMIREGKTIALGIIKNIITS